MMQQHTGQMGFDTTHWSVVIAAKGDDTKAKVALRKLCELYRVPIMRHIERTLQTYSPQRYGGRNAEDLTHDFLVQLLEEGMFEHLERQRGRFRSYLLGAVQHFLSNVRQRESTTKRGGGFVHVSMHDGIPQADEVEMFDRDWAQMTIDRAVASLGNSPETQSLLPYLTREISAEDRTSLATKLGKSEAGIKVALHRLRKKFRENVREQICETVECVSEVDAELNHLVRACAGLGLY